MQSIAYHFDNHKRDIIKALQQPEVSDKSKKGGVDAPIAEIIDLFNESENYATTSSCSGRVSIFVAKPIETKSSGEWLYITHEAIESDEIVLESLKNIDRFPTNTVISYKFEPLVIHVMCRSIKDAKKLQDITTACGFRNCGLTMGKSKLTFAIRNTILLDVPIAVSGNLMVSEDYIKYLVKLSNEKFEQNQVKIDKLTKALNDFFGSQIKPLATRG